MVGINKKQTLEDQLKSKHIQPTVFWFKKLISYLVLQQMPKCLTCDTKLSE